MTPSELTTLREEVTAIGRDLAALEQRATMATAADAWELLRDVLPIFGRTSAVQNPYIDLRPLRPGEEPRLMPAGFEDVYVPSHAFHARASVVVARCHQALGWPTRP